MATDAERKRYVEGLEKKRLAGGKLDEEDSSILEDAKDIGIIRRSGPVAEITRQFKGQAGTENAKAVGGVGADAGGAYFMSRLASKVPGAKGHLLKLLLGGVGAAGSNKFINQQAIHGKSPEQVDNTEVGLSGGAEVVLPPAFKGLAGAVKLGKGLVGDLGSAILDNTKDTATGNFFRQLIGKSAAIDPKVSVQAGQYIEDKAAAIRSGKEPADNLSIDTQKHINDVKLSSRVATEFKGKLLSLFDGISSKSYFGQEAMKIQKTAGQELIEKGVLDFVKKFKSNMTPTQLSNQVSKAINGTISFATELRHRNFTALDVLGKEVKDFKGVDLSNITKATNEAGEGFFSFKEAVEMLDKASNTTVKNRIKGALKAAANKVDLGREAVDGNAVAEGMRSAFADNPEMLIQVETLIKQSANKLLNSAVAFSSKNAKLINNTTIREVANTNPEKLLGSIFTDGNSDTLRAVMSMKDEAGEYVLSKEQKDGLRAAWLGTIQGEGKMGASGILTKASDQVGTINVLNGDKLLKVLQDAEGRMGEEFGRVMFPGTGFKGLKKFAKYLQSQQTEGQGAIGAMSIALGTPAAIGALMGVGTTALLTSDSGMGSNPQTYLTVAGAGTLLFSPKGMAAFLNNPKTRDALLNGIKKNSKNLAELKKYMGHVVAQTMAKQFGATFVSEEDKLALAPQPQPVQFQGGGGL